MSFNQFSQDVSFRYRSLLVNRDIWIANILRKHIVFEPSKLKRVFPSKLHEWSDLTECITIILD